VTSFIEKTMKPFLIIARLGTAIAGVSAFIPQYAVENLLKLPFAENYTIIVQHWGMMILLVGIFMIISAFRITWRIPVLLYSVFEKAFMVSLYIFNARRPFSASFQGAAIMDGIIVIYLLLYFWTLREK